MAAPAEVLLMVSPSADDAPRCDRDSENCSLLTNGNIAHHPLLKCCTDDICDREDTSFKRRKLEDTPFAVQEQREASDSEDDNDSTSDSEEWIGNFSKVNSHFTESLSTLQNLLPCGLELEEDEILRVAIEYVKELEKQIQMFDSSSAICSHGLDDTPLQKRGLCIVPLSTLAKAL